MIVSDVMSPDVKFVTPQTTVADARELMRRERIHHLVVKQRGGLVGIVSARDLGRRSPQPSRQGRTVSEVMNRHVLAVDGKATLGRVAYLMRGHSVGCLVVRERGVVTGIVTTSDLLGKLENVARRERAKAGSAIHHRVSHRHRDRGDGMW